MTKPTNNPYQASSQVSAPVEEDRRISRAGFFSLNGRIGRLHYAGYLVLCMMLNWFLPRFLIFPLLISLSRGTHFIYWFPLLSALIVYLPPFAYLYIFARRRLQDVDGTGFMAWACLVPLLGLAYGMLLLVAAGDAKANACGPAPEAPRNALLWWAVIATGIVLLALHIAAGMNHGQGIDLH